MLRRHKPNRISRRIDPKYLARAQAVTPDLVGTYLDSIATALHYTLDQYRFHKGPSEEVELALDAFIALWTANPPR